MRPKSLLAVVALVACAGAGITGVAHAGGAAKTKVTVKGSSEIYGFVKSSKKKCMNNRKVTVFRQKGSRGGGDDVRVASDNAEKSGDRYRWSIGNPGLQGKRIYARAGRIPGCKAGASATYRVPS
ncbi:MAG TPA: hypothetical protein VK919_13725 [Solirubrobacterales bacterium]|nr:hypothetical protein [Solirubrobacterales bacterium]